VLKGDKLFLFQYKSSGVSDEKPVELVGSALKRF
jgi:hypothetical protein